MNSSEHEHKRRRRRRKWRKALKSMYGSTWRPVAAARMNSELGRSYNTTRHLAWSLGNGLDIESRYGWGVMADRWGEEDIGGIAGSNTDGDGYS